MINVGIVGSSYSEGGQNNRIEGKTNSKFLTDIFKEYNTNNEINFYSRARGGLGSEQFLSDVIYLKQKYNISILLIEIIENRSKNQLKNQHTVYKEIIKKSNYDRNLFLDLFKEKRLGLYENHWPKFTPKNERLFFTIHDIVQTLNLCNLLNIKTITWLYRQLPENIEVFDSMKLVDVKWGLSSDWTGGIGFFEYFFKKYNGKEELFTVDSDHLNDECNVELVKDFLLPKIYERT